MINRSISKKVHIGQVILAFLLVPLMFVVDTSVGLVVSAVVLYYYFNMVGMHVGNHKYWTHQSFETSPIGEWFMLIAAWFGLQGHPVYWGKGHLDHHDPDKVDTMEDPIYRSRRSGNPFVALWHNHTDRYNEGASDNGFMKRILKNPRANFSYKYDIINVIYPIAMALLGIEYLVWLWAVPVAASVFVCGMGVIHGHNNKSGYQTYKIDDSVNLGGLWGLVYCGGELENNHHKYPDRCDYAVKEYEMDLGYSFIVPIIAKADTIKQ